MDRRRFIVTSGALGGASGCITAARDARTPTSAEAAAQIAMLDNALAEIDRGSPLAMLANKMDPVRHAQEESFLRASMRSMTVAGVLRDLPEELQVHPDFQARVWRALPEMDEAVLGAHRRLIALSPPERKALQNAFIKDKNLEDRIFSRVDLEAGAAGVSLKRRMNLRVLASDVCARLRQSPDLLIDELDRKVEAARKRPRDAEQIEKRVAAAMGAAEFADFKARLGAHHARWNVPAQVPTGSLSASSDESTPKLTADEVRQLRERAILNVTTTPPSLPRNYERPGDGTLSAGGWLLGLSVVLFGGGLLIVAAGAFPGVFVATAGVLIAIAGIIVCIVGAVQNAVV